LRINGSKIWITNTSYADVIHVLARDEVGGFTNVLVEMNRPGVSIRELEKLGLEGSSLGQIDLVDVDVPIEHIVGEPGTGLKLTMNTFERARSWASIIALGIAEQAMDMALRYSRDRFQFGVPIGSFQLVQQTLATMATDIETSRLLIFRTLRQMDMGIRCDYEAAMAKAFTTEAAVRVTGNAIQIHGAAGLIREGGVERHFRDAKMLTIPDGTTHINQLLIGRHLVGMSAFSPPMSAKSN
jgi:alkylation response protein AidB-like acyl-CoA dehydrogenase